MYVKVNQKQANQLKVLKNLTRATEQTTVEAALSFYFAYIDTCAWEKNAVILFEDLAEAEPDDRKQARHDSEKLLLTMIRHYAPEATAAYIATMRKLGRKVPELDELGTLVEKKAG